MSPYRCAATAALVLLLTACAAPASNGRASGETATPARGDSTIAPVAGSPSPGGAGPAGDTGASGDQARIARLEREARAVARTTGCTSADACRSAPVGARPCGGPRTYLTYCAATTDSAALFRKLRELETLERGVNERSGMMSTCEFRSPPDVALVGGSCREAATQGASRAP